MQGLILYNISFEVCGPVCGASAGLHGSPLVSSHCCCESPEGRAVVYRLLSVWASLPLLGLLQGLVQPPASHPALERLRKFQPVGQPLTREDGEGDTGW